MSPRRLKPEDMAPGPFRVVRVEDAYTLTPDEETNHRIRHVRGLKGEHVGRDALVIGCGPSIEDFDFSCLDGSGLVVIGTNRAGLLPIQLDYWIQAEKRRWFETTVIPQLPINTKVLMQPRLLSWSWDANPRLLYYYFRRVNLMAFDHPQLDFLPEDRVEYDRVRGDGAFFCGLTVAALGVELARFVGARRVYLLGVDCAKRGNKYYGHRRWRFSSPNRTEENLLEMMKDTMEFGGRHLWEDMDIVNVSPESSVTAFPKWSHDQLYDAISARGAGHE